MARTEQGHIFTGIVLETFKLNGLLVAEGDKLGAPIGLTSARWKVLGALAESQEPMTVSQIARNKGQARQSVQTIVNALSEDGFVDLQDNPDHKRAKLVSLTPEGADIFRRMMAIQTPWANKCGEQVSVEDLKTTLATLEKLSSLL